MISVGGVIGFYGGDTLKLKDVYFLIKDFLLFKPTIFASVPRIYNKLYEGITTKTNALTGVSKKISDMAVNSKLYWLKNGAYYAHKLYDKLVFNKVK